MFVVAALHARSAKTEAFHHSFSVSVSSGHSKCLCYKAPCKWYFKKRGHDQIFLLQANLLHLCKKVFYSLHLSNKYSWSDRIQNEIALRRSNIPKIRLAMG
ncbi:hypothetical protein NPIL_23441 [Nephila pilipes]|uniref:Uncharacterized protein n=1 Tax=Nephila pilipes TaxID=299642 RepID=A0A8X6IV71_NEPPI|nr:hypothetical protein NPIL_23441 [Nephila pilipes]